MPAYALIVLAAVLALPTFQGRASDTFAQAPDLSGSYYDDASRGWVWYETPPALAPPVEPIKPAPTAGKGGDGAPALSAEWMRANLDHFRDAAIDHPTEKNVELYLYLQRVAMDKASRFTEVSQRVVMNHPALDENLRSPQSAPAKIAADEERRTASHDVLVRIAHTAGIWYFFRSDCPYCRVQSPVLETLERLYGFHVLPISLDAKALPDGRYANFRPDTGQAERLGVTVTPTLFLITSAGDVIPLSEGVRTRPEIEERLIAKGHDAHLVTDVEFAAAQTAARSNLMDSLPEDLPATAGDDPEKLRRLLEAAAMHGGGTPVAIATPVDPEVSQ